MQAARSLVAMGIEKGNCVSILAFNRPEWIIADVACMMAGGIPAGIYQTCSPQEVQYIITHSESKVLFVENEEQWKKVASQLDQLPNLAYIVTMRGTRIDHPKTKTWEEFLNFGSDILPKALTPSSIISRLINPQLLFIRREPRKFAPKAVMLSHNNLCFTADRAISLPKDGGRTAPSPIFRSLTLQNRSLVFTDLITSGSAVYFADPLKHFHKISQRSDPPYFGVPRIGEKIHSKLRAGIADASFVKKKIAGW